MPNPALSFEVGTAKCNATLQELKAHLGYRGGEVSRIIRTERRWQGATLKPLSDARWTS